MIKHLGYATCVLFASTLVLADPPGALNAAKNEKQNTPNSTRGGNGGRYNGGRPGQGGTGAPRTTPQGHSQMNKTMQSAQRVSQCARSMKLNPMDTFRRAQYKSAMDDLNNNLRQLTSEVKKGNVAPDDVGHLQKQMAQTINAENDGKSLVKQAIDSAKDGDHPLLANPVARAIRREVREQLNDDDGARVVFVSASAANSAASAEAKSSGDPSTQSATTPATITPSTLLAEVADPAAQVNVPAPAEVQSTMAFRQMDVLLAPSSFGKPEEHFLKPLAIQRIRENRRGIRTADAGTGDGGGAENVAVVGADRDEDVATSVSAQDEEVQLEADLAAPATREEILLAGPNGVSVVGEVNRKTPAPLRAGFSADGLWGAPVKPELLLRPSETSPAIAAESAWDDAGRFALLTVIVGASLTLLAFYLRSTFKAHRRDVAGEHKILPFTKHN